jgi:phosphoglycolate phosphatase
MKKFRCVIFDLDGTLADTLDDLVANINRSLEENKFAPVSREIIRKMQGGELETMVLAALPPGNEHLVDKLTAGVLRFYAEAPLHLAKPYPQIPELLLELGRKKCKTAVLTNKPDHVAHLEIDRLFPFFKFGLVNGIRPGFPNKPDPGAVWEILTELDVSPRDTVLMGDSETDMKAALDSECHAVGVSWGYKDKAVIKAAGAQRIIDSPLELLEFI